jgi:hypothetical protein
MFASNWKNLLIILMQRQLRDFPMKFSYEDNLKEGLNIILIYPYFNLFVMGDLSSFMPMSLVCPSQVVTGALGALCHELNGNNLQRVMERSKPLNF